MTDSMTVLRKAGPAGTKRNIAVLGHGFTAADHRRGQHPTTLRSADRGSPRVRRCLIAAPRRHQGQSR